MLYAALDGKIYRKRLRELAKYLENGYCHVCGETVPFVKGKRRRQPYCSTHLDQVREANKARHSTEIAANAMVRRNGILWKKGNVSH
jgi:hypothetical protein